MVYNNKMRWTDDELSILRDCYYVVSRGALSLMLPGRSRSAITQKVAYLRRRGWAFKGRTKK